MAHKTFISYKYSESRHYRDIILSALGNDAIYYKGETSESPDLTDYTTDTIKHHLKEMIYDTSVTIDYCFSSYERERLDELGDMLFSQNYFPRRTCFTH